MAMNLNVNGTLMDFTTEWQHVPVLDATFKIFNTMPTPLYAVDIFIQSTSKDDLDWLLQLNGDGTPRFSVKIDNTQTFPISSGLRGEKFSNPITYVRSGVSSNPSVMLPSGTTSNQTPFQFLFGPNMMLVNDSDDYLPISIVKSDATIIGDLVPRLQTMILIVQPSQFVELSTHPFYSIDTPPSVNNINIRY